ncbi:hypothetical protein [Kocuria flava]|uniref:hypothetical protein n=1 Tax=Kocuria flava TaxID=446860 RepID=UPI000A4964EB|nr:hypothetical protein [Kocuria flava]MCJ8505618.1 hypothetical protein [Kocuria flava]
MPHRTDPHRARRRRRGGAMLAAGVVALFAATFTVPEAIIHLARATAEDPVPLGPRAVTVTVLAVVFLVGGGLLTIVAFNRRRATEEPHPEDLADDAEFGDAPLRPFDPDRFRHRPGRAADDDGA